MRQFAHPIVGRRMKSEVRFRIVVDFFIYSVESIYEGNI
jgi:hypothetical protein